MEKSKNSIGIEKLLPFLTPVFSLLFALFVSVMVVYYTIPNLSFAETTGIFFKSLFEANFNNLTAFSNFMINSTPLILTGLAHSLAFRSGLFNIGVEGQYTVAAITAAALGLIKGLPFFIHVPIVIIGALAAGAFWAFIPGFFKAVRGTNEVVNTIMMNYIAMHVFNYIVRVPLKQPNSVQTETIQPSAQLLRFMGDRYRINIGIFIAIGVAFAVWYFLNKTKSGYELRATGFNMYGAEYGGINRKKNIILGMVISGGLAGLAAVTQVLGPDLAVKELAAFSGYGFNGIAVALLAKSNPIGVILSALLFGSLLNAGPYLQMQGISKDLVYIMQALVILFVAADYIWKIIIDRRKKKEVAKVG